MAVSVSVIVIEDLSLLSLFVVLKFPSRFLIIVVSVAFLIPFGIVWWKEFLFFFLFFFFGGIFFYVIYT